MSLLPAAHMSPFVSGRRAGLCVVLLGSAAWISPVAAADPVPAPAAPAAKAAALGNAKAAQAVEEVIVTAERRRTNLQKTPLSVTRLGSAKLEQAGAHAIRDLAGQAPNVEVPRGGLTPTTQVFFIRGIGTADPIQDPAVGLYVDDIFIPRPISDGGLFDLPDLDRIEVLRGPQGTLYGRNSDAGAIKLVTTDPGNTPHLIMDAAGGSYGAFQTHDLVSGPLVQDLLYGSLAFVHNQQNGTTYDPTIGQNVNDIDYNAARAKLKITPNDDLEILLTADGLLDHSTTAYYTPVKPVGREFNPNDSFSPIDPVNHLDDGGIGLRVTEKLNDELTLKSISSGRAWDQAPVIYDNSGTDPLGAANFINYHQRDYTQELQLAGDYGRFNFVTGAYFFRETFSVFRTTVAGAEYTPLLTTQNQTITDSYAGYAQGNYKITDKLTATVGLRYTLDARSFTDANYKSGKNPLADDLFDEFFPKSVLFKASSHDSWGSFTPKFGLSYQVTPDIMGYASYAEGFKGGGYDNRSADVLIAHTPFAPETVDTYEVGVKSDWLNHALRANLSLFYNDYTNLQSTIYITPFITQLVNAAQAHTDGVELETTLVPIDGLTWTNSGGYLDSAYDQFLNASKTGAAATGNRLPLAPRFNYTSALDYQLPDIIPGEIHVGGDVQFQTRSFSDVLNNPQAAIPQQTLLDFHLSYTTPDSRWTGLFTVRNALNDRYNQSGTYAPPTYYYLENPPQSFLFTLRYKI
jgi:iron complex outermembrane receptor protein